MSTKCPQCGSLAVRRSSFEGPDEQQGHVLLSTYRCENCGAHFCVISLQSALYLDRNNRPDHSHDCLDDIPWLPGAEIMDRRASAAVYESAMLLPDGVAQCGRTVARRACCEICSCARSRVQGAGYWLS